MRTLFNFACLLCFFLAACCYFAAVQAKPAKERPPVLFDPAGSWQGAKGDSVYIVTITADETYWRSRWTDENDRLCWAGVLVRTAAGFLERYDPAVSGCPDWTWKEDGPALLGTDNWKLSIVPDF